MARKALAVRNGLVFALAVLLIGAAVGAFIWAFLFLMNAGLTLLWDVLPSRREAWFLPIIVCGIGGVLIGLVQKRYGPYPENMQAVMAKVKRDGTYGTDKVKASTLGAILPLVFGGSVGPEAGLVGVIAGLCSWVGTRLRHLGAEFRELAAVGSAASLSAIFGAPLFGFAELAEEDIKRGIQGAQADADTTSEVERAPKWVRMLSYACAAAGAFGVMALLNSLSGGGAGLPHLSGMTIGKEELIAFVPVALLGAIAGWLFHAGEHGTHALSHRLGDRPVLKAVIAGLVLGVCGSVLPFTMFAGEHQTHEVMETWATLGGAALIATCYVKVLLTPLCINFGWRGGHFFPVIFSGVALGYGIAILTGVDPVFCACVGAAAVVGGVMRSPVMATLLLFLCFPVKAAPVLLLASLVGIALPLPAAWRPAKKQRKIRASTR